jgi:hypothetical protein
MGSSWMDGGANSAGSVGSGTQGNDTYYGANGTTVSPIPNLIHAHAYLGASPDPLHAAFAACPSNANCTVVGDPGDSYTLSSPLLIGTPSAGTALQQTLVLNNASVVCNDSTTFPQDDCIVLSSNANLYCTGHGNSTHPSNIYASTNTNLNSVVTTLGGVILQPWQASTGYKVGQFIFDSTSSTVDQVSACSGACTSGTGPSAPSFSSTPGNTITDNLVTWKTLIYNASRITGGGFRVTIRDCDIGGSTSSTSQINNVLRLSGVNGGLTDVQNVVVKNISTAAGSLGANGFCTANGVPQSCCTGSGTGTCSAASTGLLVDPGQTNGFCTANGSPLACCTGAGTGNCQSGQNNTLGVLIHGFWVAPGGVNGNGPGFGAWITGNGGTTQNITIDTGQIGDIYGTNNVALLGIDQSAHAVNVRDIYFETNSGGSNQQNTSSDNVLLNGAQDVDISDFFMGTNGGSAVTNCFHITSNANTYRAHFVGRVINSPCGNGSGKLVKNDIDSQFMSASLIPTSLDYYWNKSGASTSPTFDGASVSSIGGYQTVGNFQFNGTPTTLAGTSAGDVYWSQPEQGSAYKKTLLNFEGYENTTSTAQTITFSTPYSYTPTLEGSCPSGLSVSTTTATLPISMSSTFTGQCLVEGQ